MSACFASESYLWREQGERGKERSELELRNWGFLSIGSESTRINTGEGLCFQKNKSDTREIYLNTACWSKHMLHNERGINNNCRFAYMCSKKVIK